ncbi:MAG TPA: hypothetical protein VLK30_03390 [Candidatus Limnocylindrales bacterium]|nr:hypothetical protein [Candidatus Limnocylindrales bacterium]
MRRVALAAGAALVILAFAAATRVADTREGLIAEVITLLASLVAVGLLVYALTARRGTPLAPRAQGPVETRSQPRPRTRRDLLLGAAGVAIALFLVTGLALSGGALWATFGLLLLVPMIAGSVYLCVRYLRANP